VIGGLLGGIGVFLIGMLLLSEGLKSAGGDSLRAILQRFARGPVSAILTGVTITLLVQSSSATVLMTIGFVSAGLLTFPQAVGVILGANLGTTSTGWLVSLIGFKLSLTLVALPIVGVGALLRVLAKGKLGFAGGAIAGFGLIFVGIDVLQGGMAGLTERIDLAPISGDSLWSEGVLVAAGFAMTVIMQSSSAAVATTLAGVHAGTLTLEQSTLLVIGQNVGTTVTAMLAAIGGSVQVKRTAMAHILFNLVTALIVFLLLRFLLAGLTLVAADHGPAVAVAVFHTFFSLLGILLFFPVIDRFSALIEKLIPERVPSLVAHLDMSVAQIPAVAIEAARRSGTAIGQVLFESCLRLLERDGEGRTAAIPSSTKEEITRLRDFAASIGSASVDPEEHGRHIALLHLVDHLDGLLGAAHDFAPLASDARQIELETGWGLLRQLLGPALAQGHVTDEATAEALSKELAKFRKEYRRTILDATARNETDPSEAWKQIEAIKLLDRMGYHAWRVMHYLGESGREASRA